MVKKIAESTKVDKLKKRKYNEDNFIIKKIFYLYF